jgi:hypothetical protein
MAFPISVLFNRSLKTVISSDNKEQIFQYIKKNILEDKADNVIVEDMRISYQGSTSNWRGSLFGSVDNGTFDLFSKENDWFLNYQINMRKLFIGTAILSTIAGVCAQVGDGLWWVGIAAFLWLCGANWIIIFIRHGSEATSIAIGIDELICGKEQPLENNEGEGRLKSWF